MYSIQTRLYTRFKQEDRTRTLNIRISFDFTKSLLGDNYYDMRLDMNNPPFVNLRPRKIEMGEETNMKYEMRKHKMINEFET